jgi:uncharacterized membrane protein
MRTREGLSRFITFADAVVAISVTLLVLPLVDLASTADASDSLGELLQAHSSQVFSFLLSFVVIMRFWVSHHRVVEHVATYDSLFIRCTILWMFTIVVLPFVTELIAVYGDEELAKGLYIGALLASSASVSLLTLHVTRTPEIRAESSDADALSAVPTVVNTALLLVALLVALVIPGVNYYALLLLLLSSPVIFWWNRRTRKRPSTGPTTKSRTPSRNAGH